MAIHDAGMLHGMLAFGHGTMLDPEAYVIGWAVVSDS